MQKYKFTKWSDIWDLPLSNKQRTLIVKICEDAKQVPFIYKRGVCGNYSRLSLGVRGMRFKPAIHTLVYLYYNRDTDLTGFEIDHIDRNKFNNSIKNLRLTTRAENNSNSNRCADSQYTHIDEIRNFRSLGYGCTRLASIFNTSSGNIWRFIKRHGL